MYFQVKKSNEETELDSFKTFPRLYLFIFKMLIVCYGFPGGSVVKNPSADAGDIGDAGSIPGLGRPTERGNGNPLQYFCLDNTADGGAWLTTVHSVTKSQTQWQQLCMHPLSPLVTISLFTMTVSLFLFCK